MGFNHISFITVKVRGVVQTQLFCKTMSPQTNAIPNSAEYLLITKNVWFGVKKTCIFFEKRIHDVHINLMCGLVFLEIAFISHLFIEENLTAGLYLNILEEAPHLLITVKLETEIDEEDNLVYQKDLLHFQQDGASSHYLSSYPTVVKREFSE